MNPKANSIEDFPLHSIRAKKSKSTECRCFTSRLRKWCNPQSSRAKARLFYIQAVLVWMALCLPGNIVTLVLYCEVSQEVAPPTLENDSVLANINGSFLESSNFVQLETVPSKVEVSNGGLVEVAAADANQSIPLEEAVKIWQVLCQNQFFVNLSLDESCVTCSLDQAQKNSCSCRSFPNRQRVCVLDLAQQSPLSAGGSLTKQNKNQARKHLADLNKHFSSHIKEVACSEQNLKCLLIRLQRLLSQVDDEPVRWKSGNDSNGQYVCHETTKDYQHFVNKAQFWLEGVLLLLVSFFGITGNILTMVVLNRKVDAKTTFNRLLISLAIVDSFVLINYSMDNGLVGTFNRAQSLEEPYWYRVSYPYVLHPLKTFFINCSIFMVVAISAERHGAICSPLTHRPAFWPYAITVFCIAGASNIPRFFEFRLSTDEAGRTDYWTTPLNENKDYITFSSWWDELIVTGILPFFALVIFNSRIYLKLKASDRQEYRFVGRKNLPIRTRDNRASCRSTAFSSERITQVVSVNIGAHGEDYYSRAEAIDPDGIEMKPLPSYLRGKPAQRLRDPLKQRDRCLSNSANNIVSLDSGKNMRELQLNRILNQTSVDAPRSYLSPIDSMQKDQTKSWQTEDLADISINSVPIERRRISAASTNLRSTDGHEAQHFRKRREKSAMILISIVLTFLFCHAFRLVIQAYEVTHPSHSTAEHHAFCQELERFHVPVAFYVMLSASHLLMAVNSSVNFIIYCCVGKAFRAELKLILASLARTLKCSRN